MSLRKRLLGLAGVVAAAGAVAAEPPVSPLVEGREPDPVAREFYLPERSAGGYVPGPADPERSDAGGWVAIAAGVWDVLLDRFTVPLGTAAMRDAGPQTEL